MRFPSEDPAVGAVVLNERVVVDGVDVVTAPTAADAIILWTVTTFVFSLKYGNGAGTSRFIAAHVLGIEDDPPKDRA